MFKFTICIMLLSTCMSASIQSNEEVPSDPDEAIQHARRLLLDVPCLPCFEKDGAMCRKIFGCVVVGENDTTLVEEYPETSAATSNNSNKNAGPLNTESDDSLCLPCFEIDYLLRCRKIRGCVVSSTTSATNNKVASESPETELAGVNTTTSPQDVNVTDGIHENSSYSVTTDDGSVPQSSSGGSVFISDVPLIKTLAPSVITASSTTAKMQSSSEIDQGVSSTTDSLLKTTKISATTESLLKTIKPSATTESLLKTTLISAATTQATTTTTVHPCKQKYPDGNYGVDFWCYIQQLLNWNG